MRRGVSACGKSHHRDLVRITEPFLRMGPGISHSLCRFLQGFPITRRRHRIPDYRRLDPQGQQAQSHRLRFPVAAPGIGAAGKNQRKRSFPFRFHRPVVCQIGFQFHSRSGKGNDLMPHIAFLPRQKASNCDYFTPVQFCRIVL